MATYSVGDLSRREILKMSAVLAGSGVFPSTGSAGAASPQGQLTWGVHISLAPTWFDPAETPGIITPFMVMYALHDAMVKPMPGQPLAPSLAESWTASEDALTYEFVVRKGAKFHNGDDVTAEDVKCTRPRAPGRCPGRRSPAQREEAHADEIDNVSAIANVLASTIERSRGAGTVRFRRATWMRWPPSYSTTHSRALSRSSLAMLHESNLMVANDPERQT